ncbi:MAG: thioredoxin domain-containing protein, partial [Halobacteriales archaeon]
MTDRMRADESASPSLDRRGMLSALGAVVAGGIAGCMGGGSATTEKDTTEPTPTTAGGNGLANHPAGRGITDQPRLGPAPKDATGVVVAFEDPSCTRCRAFHRQVLPQLESKLIDPGDVA